MPTALKSPPTSKHAKRLSAANSFNNELHQTVGNIVGDRPELPLENQEDLDFYKNLRESYSGKAYNVVHFDPESTFVGQPGITGQRGIMISYDANGEEIGCWTIVSGGFATDYRLGKLGGSGSTRIAKGTYSSGMPSHGEFYPSGKGYTYGKSLPDPGFYNHGYSFKYGVGVPGNNSILFHPQGYGTQGCIGLTCEPDGLFQFNAHMLNSSIKGRKIDTIVK